MADPDPSQRHFTLATRAITLILTSARRARGNNETGPLNMARRKILPLGWALSICLSFLLATWIAAARAARTASAPGARLAANPGDVVINEVAWMGTAASYTDEWIELYNTTGAPITLTGWSLVAEDGTPTIALEGDIPAQGFFVLERNDDTTISDLVADQVYAGSLENDPDAEKLSLRDPSNLQIDAVNLDGGGWPAGNNDTKSSMERRDPLAPGSDGNWANNDGLTRNGSDAHGAPLNGTPKQPNSAFSGLIPNEADLAVAKYGPDVVTQGDRITYTLALTNIGAIEAADVLLTDQLPAEVTFVTASVRVPWRLSGRYLVITAGEIITHAPRLTASVIGLVDAAASGMLLNTITATTTTSESLRSNNLDSWETRIARRGAHVLINAALFDGYQLDDHDEAVQLINVGESAADLSGWSVCDAAEGNPCVTIVDGLLGAKETAWLTYWATDFLKSFGTLPAYAVNGTLPGTEPVAGSWPLFANSGGQVVLKNPEGRIVDTVVYKDGDFYTPGWSGPAVEPWGGREGFRLEGQILFRKRDELSGLPIADTNTVNDWSQYAGDTAYGRRVQYPGWDLDSLFTPLSVTQDARVTIGVAPDNVAEIVFDAIDGAQTHIQIAAYSLTDPAVIQALLAKAESGVHVSLLLEGDQTGVSKSDPLWYEQMWACEGLHDSGHGECWFMVNDDAERVFDRYRFMHAKYMLVDGKSVLISSQNFTTRGMPSDRKDNGTHGSRGTVLLTDAPAVVARVTEVFELDLDPDHHNDLLAWAPDGQDYGPPAPDFTPVLTVTDHTTYTVVFSRPLVLEGDVHMELITSPEAAMRQSDALLGLIGQAGSQDQIYVEMMDERDYWGDDPETDTNPRMEAYIAAARRGARVRILLNSGDFEAEYYDTSNNLAAVTYANSVARSEHLDLVATLGDPTSLGIHNKMILVWLAQRGGFVHLGSLNGSETSNKINREIAIQIQSDQAFSYLRAVFNWDWWAVTPKYLPILTMGWSRPAPPVDYPVISEIYYDPPGADEAGEWVELYNPTPHAVDLSGWLLGDVGPAGEFGSGLYAFPDGSVLAAGEVLLVARQAADAIGFSPDLEFVIDPGRNDPHIPDMLPAGNWDGFGLALGNAGDEVILLNPPTQRSAPSTVDAVVYGDGSYPGVVPHPGVDASGHSIERRPAIYDSDDCSRDFFDRFPPDPGGVDQN
jgi:uncharacterized repeat protein (TIGR01451 family)